MALLLLAVVGQLAVLIGLLDGRGGRLPVRGGALARARGVGRLRAARLLRRCPRGLLDGRGGRLPVRGGALARARGVGRLRAARLWLRGWRARWRTEAAERGQGPLALPLRGERWRVVGGAALAASARASATMFGAVSHGVARVGRARESPGNAAAARLSA